MWLKEGDKNTKYFHKFANSHRRHTSIRHLSINGELSSDLVAIKAQIIEFYKTLYTEDSGCRPLLDGLHFSSISSDEACWLERPFEEEEIFKAVSNMNGDKARADLQMVSPWLFSMLAGLFYGLICRLSFRNFMGLALFKGALMLHSSLSSLRRLMQLR
jgi:hypothetical protein